MDLPKPWRNVSKQSCRSVLVFLFSKTSYIFTHTLDYQQIGRAGRDGLEAQCIMYCNSADFDKYKNDFYLGGLSSDARSNQEMSIESLRTFSMSDEACRRAELLKFFDESPSFGERCGTCDTCVARSLHSDDIERDFADSGARLMLYAISVLNGKQGISNLDKILRGNKIEEYRYNSTYINHDAVKENVNRMKSQMSGYKKRVPVTYFTKDLLPALVIRGFAEVESQSMKVNGRTNSWSGYRLSATGRRVLESGPIMLPVPASIREYEKEHQEKIQKSLEDLKKVGADIDQIPKHELEEGDGTVFKAIRTWYNYLDLLQRNGRTRRIDDLEDLRLRMDAWRMDVAAKYRIAPSDAMPDHL
jgi:superfamily II DNA helicase RecQ